MATFGLADRDRQQPIAVRRVAEPVDHVADVSSHRAGGKIRRRNHVHVRRRRRELPRRRHAADLRDHRVEILAGRRVDADEVDLALVVGLGQSVVVQDLGDLRAQAVLQLLLRLGLRVSDRREPHADRVARDADRDVRLGEGHEVFVAHRSRRRGCPGGCLRAGGDRRCGRERDERGASDNGRTTHGNPRDAWPR